MVIFKSKQKKFEGDLKIKLCGKRLYPTEILYPTIRSIVSSFISDWTCFNVSKSNQLFNLL